MYLPALYGSRRDAAGNPAWVHLKNRIESLTPNPSGPGVRCEFPFSSRLHACDYIPGWSSGLMRRALTDWPIEFSEQLATQGTPVASFLFAHRGEARLGQLIQVIKSVFAQRDVPVEVIVADLTRPHLGERLPEGVQHLAIDDSHLTPGWRKAWAFNIAARQARGRILVFQDGDICVPRDYAGELIRQFDKHGWQAASLQRFLFYLDEASMLRVTRENQLVTGGIEAVTQNWKGGTIAIRRDCFFEIGGFDEGFVDWGGEDDEFYDRCGTLRHNRFGYLPFVHLWHPPQAVRKDQPNPNLRLVTPWRNSMSRESRCAELSQRDFGQKTSPVPAEAYKETLQRQAHSAP